MVCLKVSPMVYNLIYEQPRRHGGVEVVRTRAAGGMSAEVPAR